MVVFTRFFFHQAPFIFEMLKDWSNLGHFYSLKMIFYDKELWNQSVYKVVCSPAMCLVLSNTHHSQIFPNSYQVLIPLPSTSNGKVLLTETSVVAVPGTLSCSSFENFAENSRESGNRAGMDKVEGPFKMWNFKLKIKGEKFELLFWKPPGRVLT